MASGPPPDPRAGVPDSLLTPFLEAAADTLRGLESADVPALLRHLHGFERRGLLRGPGPRSLRRAFDEDERFRERVLARFGSQPSVAGVLAQWAEGDAWDLVAATIERQDLPLLVSTLWACRPEGAEFGLGLAVAFDRFERRDRGDEDAARLRARELAALEEARRRADAARMTAEAEATRAADELRGERRARRAREEEAEAQAQSAYRRAEGLAAQLQQASAAHEDERLRATREAQRARTLEADLRRARAEVAELTARIEHAPSRLDAQGMRALAEATATTQRLAAQLESLQGRIETRGSHPSAAAASPAARRQGPRPEKPLARRVRPPLPPGVVAASAPGIAAMLRAADALLVIDGYNVTKRAWPDASPAEQRERLGVAVTQLHRRLGCAVLCVFDGDGSGPRPGIQRGGVRVLFSDADEEADEVVVREVAALPKRIPVVVASSDAWIREHAEAAGAVVVPADALLDTLRRAR
jgi:predicted RNA-binding protein with PIN domain